MIKRFIFTALLLMMCAISASAYDFEVGGLCYNLNSDGTSVTVTCKERREDDPGYYKLPRSIKIPATVKYKGETYSVTAIGNGAFRQCNKLKSNSMHDFTVTIPESVTLIGNDAFHDSDVTSVTIPNSVSSIGEKAFEGCSGLTSVTIGNSVTSIGKWAFCGCSGLTSVTIGNSVTTIGSSAFSACKRLASVTIPNSVTSIGAGAFYGTPIYDNHPNGVFYVDKWVCGYKGKEPYGNLVLQSDSRGIANYAFEYCRDLTSVTIPNSVTSIGAGAFYGCSGLTSVTIPNSVTSIGEEAFSDCKSLTSVKCSNNNIKIGKDAFSYCNKLTEGPPAIMSTMLEVYGFTEYQISRYNECLNGNATAADMVEIAYQLYKENLYELAFPLFSKAAEQGNAVAQYYLGNYYTFGWGNISKDSDKGVEWYRKSAEQGHSLAQVLLGTHYEYTENKAEAVKWYRKAAEQDNPSAQRHLYLCYRDGIGVAKNATLANQWLKKAADNGNEEAKTEYNLAALKRKIGATTYNNLSKGIITKGMKLSSIEYYARYEPKPKGAYSIMMEMKKRINNEKKYDVVFVYGTTPFRGYTIWTKNDIVTVVIQ